METIQWIIIVFLSIGSIFMIAMLVQNQAKTNCRLDALNNMCRTYAGVNGDAIDINSGNGTFTVICDDNMPVLPIQTIAWNVT